MECWLFDGQHPRFPPCGQACCWLRSHLWLLLPVLEKTLLVIACVDKPVVDCDRVFDYSSIILLQQIAGLWSTVTAVCKSLFVDALTWVYSIYLQSAVELYILPVRVYLPKWDAPAVCCCIASIIMNQSSGCSSSNWRQNFSDHQIPEAIAPMINKIGGSSGEPKDSEKRWTPLLLICLFVIRYLVLSVGCFCGSVRDDPNLWLNGCMADCLNVMLIWV